MSTKQLNKHLESYMNEKHLRQFQFNIKRYAQQQNIKKPYENKEALYKDLDNFVKTLSIKGVKV